jgi:hypothetical protein
MSENHAGHVIHGAHKTIEEMPPLKSEKNPLLAAVIGFCFGPIGVGVYFGSFRDFLYCLGFLILLFIAVPGLGIIPGWLFSAGFAFFRAISSNEHQGK